jgi:hypothetical protein
MPGPIHNPIADSAPSEEQITDYDRAHIATYLRLLDAASEGANWEEVAHIVLGIEPSREPQRARGAYESHLARAHWLTEHGYRDLLSARR